ncbi:MAG TPA: ABC transporter ATP-binding protein [Chloroflexota bacterium]|nr:ABC transporter ATP-binding protein [Chloroflexota bacterium]HZU06690.1 ABC transporter ATP-binding protein [Chloroflexota bacterium]
MTHAPTGLPQAPSGAATDTPCIVVRELAHTFGTGDSQQRLLALSNLNFTISRGQFVSLLGPSGCGKTTLLRILGGLILPTQGEVLIDGQRVEGPLEQVSMVFQDFRLLPWRTVISNVEFPLELRGVAPKIRREKALSLLAMIGLERFRDFYPHQLSGGMRQRVALARALMTDPAIVLMDEPFGALDAQTREVMQGELLKLWESWTMTIVFVTHSVDEAVLLSDEIIVMTSVPGRLKARIPIALPRPRWRDEVRNSLEFVQYRSQVWTLLRPEVTTE